LRDGPVELRLLVVVGAEREGLCPKCNAWSLSGISEFLRITDDYGVVFGAM